jgi:predicted phage terminase large subunit-like protein
VFWPAWEWGPAGLASLRYLSTSYSDSYVSRDSRRMRDLVASEWYQERWGEHVQLVRTGETSFENTAKGSREGRPFRSLTGGRGDRVLIDDPHSTETAESEAERQTTIRIFRESVPTRLINPASSAIVVIMQRLHAEDVAGTAISLNLGYEHLMLPMEFEPDRRCHTSIGFKDPRTYDGELLFPERFPREVVDRDKAAMGSYAVAGQFQQRPTTREGGLFKRAWFKDRQGVPAGVRWVRYWDLAATADQMGAEPAYTVGLKLGRTPEGRFIIGDVVRMRAEGQGVRRLIRETAQADGPMVEIGLPQDPGQAGKSQAADMVLMLAGYVVRAERESGDKVTRAEPVAAQAEAGNLDMLEADWNETFLDEATTFPASKFKDQVDALSGAFNRLIGATVFATPEEFVRTPVTRIPSTWARVAVLDVDQARIGITWAAHDRTADVAYVYDCVVTPRSDLSLLAATLRDRGPWIPVLMDAEARKRPKAEGLRIAERLNELGVDVYCAHADTGAMVEEIANRLSTGRLRVHDHLEEWFAGYRRYRRDEKGEITRPTIT